MIKQITAAPIPPKSTTGPGTSTMLLLAVLTTTGCGTKYTTTNAPIPTPILLPAPTKQPSIAPEPTELPPSAVIVPTKIPQTDAPRSLPAALALREQAATAAAQSNHIRAIGLLERAIRISPKDPDTFKALAESHLAMNRPEQALELTKRALNLNPTVQQKQALDALADRCRALL